MRVHSGAACRSSRLEGLNKETHTRILLGPRLYGAVEGRVLTRRLDGVALKGKPRPAPG